MSLDRDRVAEILNADYGYYYDESSVPAGETLDQRLKPDTRRFVGELLSPGTRVLDIGCGNGETLISLSPGFGHGVGVDHATAHIELAERARTRAGVTNVEFRQVGFDQRDASGLASDQPYDLILTERGPFGKDEHGIRAVLPLLRPGGVIFAEVVGEHHHRELRELFGPRSSMLAGSREQSTTAMERAKLSVRISADFVTKRYYTSVYEWLRYQCHIWAWINHPFPDPDDPRLETFAERNRHGEHGVVVTDHVAWVGAVLQD